MAVSQTGLFIRRFPDWLSALDLRLTGICRILEQKMGLKADALVELAGRAVEEVRQMFKNSTMPVLMDRSVSALRVAVAGIVLFFIYFVAVLLTLQEMDDIREKRSRSAFRREFLVVVERIASVVSAWLKTQAFILFLTSAVCIFGLAVIGNPYSFLFGCGIGILDAAVSEGVEKSCGDLRHLCGLLLSASDLRGETDGEAGGAFSAGIAGIHVCGT